MVRFVKNSPSFNRLNVSRADVPFVLENGVRGAACSTHPVTLYLTINIMPPNLYNSPPSIPTGGDDSPAEEATIPGPIQSPALEPLLPVSHHQPIETGSTVPQCREEVSSTSTRYHPLALDRADEAMTRIVPIDRSNTWEGAIGRIKWVMDALGPIAEVHLIPF